MTLRQFHREMRIAREHRLNSFFHRYGTSPKRVMLSIIFGAAAFLGISIFILVKAGLHSEEANFWRAAILPWTLMTTWAAYNSYHDLMISLREWRKERDGILREKIDILDPSLNLIVHE